MGSRELVLEVVNDLPDEQVEEVLDFISYLEWRRGLREDQSWFWSDEWQARIRAAESDSAAGRSRRVTADNMEDGLAWLRA